MSVYYELIKYMPSDEALMVMSPYDLLDPLPKDKVLIVLKYNHIPTEEYLETGNLFDTLYKYARRDLLYNMILSGDRDSLNVVRRYSNEENEIDREISEIILQENLVDRIDFITQVPSSGMAGEMIDISREMLILLMKKFPRESRIVRHLVNYGDMSLVKSYLKDFYDKTTHLIDSIFYVTPNNMEEYVDLLDIQNNEQIRELFDNLRYHQYQEVVLYIIERLYEQGIKRIPQNAYRDTVIIDYPEEVLKFIIRKNMIDPESYPIIFIQGPFTDELLDLMQERGFHTPSTPEYHTAEQQERLRSRGLITEEEEEED